MTSKLKLLHPLQLSQADSTSYHVRGINNLAVRSAAAVTRAVTVDKFLDRMRDITNSSNSTVKRTSPPPIKKEKFKESPTASTNLQSKDIKGEQCSYCKAKGHSKPECFKLRKKEQSTGQSLAAAALKAATTPAETKGVSSQVGCVSEKASTKLEISNSIVTVNYINGFACELKALIKTSSPVSFILSTVTKNFSVKIRNLKN